MSKQQQLKDQRRGDLIVPYTPAPPKPAEQDVMSTLGTALPMAAMFTRHKIMGWTAVVFAIQQYLNETPGPVAAGRQPAIFSIGMAFMSLGITYMPMFLPPPPPRGATTAQAPPPQPAQS